MLRIRGRKYYRPRKTLRSFTERELHGTFRVSLTMYNEIKRLCAPTMSPNTTYGGAVPLDTKILASLAVLATGKSIFKANIYDKKFICFQLGSFQHVSGQVLGISQPSVSRYLDQFVDILCENAHNYIRFPLDDEVWLRKSAAKHYKKAKMPGVIGSIDGFHVLLKNPEKYDKIYLNRKSQASVNVMVNIHLFYYAFDLQYENYLRYFLFVV
jgi:hypothetical protein